MNPSIRDKPGVGALKGNVLEGAKQVIAKYKPSRFSTWIFLGGAYSKMLQVYFNQGWPCLMATILQVCFDQRGLCLVVRNNSMSDSSVFIRPCLWPMSLAKRISTPKSGVHKAGLQADPSAFELKAS